MTTLTEGYHAGEFIVSEANGTRSREVVTIIEGQNLVAGAVLGQITTGGKYTELDPDAEDGSEVAAAVLYDAVDATDGDTDGVIIARDAEVNGAEITWPTGISGPETTAATAELAAAGIIVR